MAVQWHAQERNRDCLSDRYTAHTSSSLWCYDIHLPYCHTFALLADNAVGLSAQQRLRAEVVSRLNSLHGHSIDCKGQGIDPHHRCTDHPRRLCWGVDGERERYGCDVDGYIEVAGRRRNPNVHPGQVAKLRLENPSGIRWSFGTESKEPTDNCGNGCRRPWVRPRQIWLLRSRPRLHCRSRIHVEHMAPRVTVTLRQHLECRRAMVRVHLVQTHQIREDGVHAADHSLFLQKLEHHWVRRWWRYAEPERIGLRMPRRVMLCAIQPIHHQPCCRIDKQFSHCGGRRIGLRCKLCGVRVVTGGIPQLSHCIERADKERVDDCVHIRHHISIPSILRPIHNITRACIPCAL
eukprot:m.223595 g.223595  ORF g.223595 m.223595 type:complete len:349 (+) comp25850_c0_seq1:134-1180(+)